MDFFPKSLDPRVFEIRHLNVIDSCPCRSSADHGLPFIGTAFERHRSRYLYPRASWAGISIHGLVWGGYYTWWMSIFDKTPPPSSKKPLGDPERSKQGSRRERTGDPDKSHKGDFIQPVHARVPIPKPKIRK
jgi:hypothetical protein